MGGLDGRGEQRRIADIREALHTIRIGAECVMATVIPAVRELLETETVLLYTVAESDTAWKLSRWHHSGDHPACGAYLERALSRTEVESVFYYDALKPAAAQRNRVVEAAGWIDRDRPGTWESSRMCREVMEPLKMHRYRQPRALICEGPVLLAWFGALQASIPTRKQLRALAALVPAMKKRLTIERQLDDAARTSNALRASLDQLGVAAFLIDIRGRIVDANIAGRALLDDPHMEVRTVLRDALAKRPAAAHVDLVPLVERGVAAHFLALVRSGSPDTRVETHAAAWRKRWSLTARQADVLALAVRGLANASIAVMLQIGERSVEHHMTAIFDRAGVDSRAALVARVLTSYC